MNSYSLKKKILLSVVLALAVIIILLSWYSYSSQKALLLKTSIDNVSQSGKQQAMRIEEWLADRQRIVESVASKVEGNTLNALQQAKLSGDFELTYFGDNQGKMTDSDPNIDRSGYDPRSRPWYKQAQLTSGTVITKPYLDTAFNQLVVSIAKTTQSGVVAGDLSIETLVDSVNTMSLPADGYAIMMHKDGTVIAYKDTKKVMADIAHIDSKINHQLILSNSQNSEFTPIYFKDEGREKLVWGENINNTDWQLLFVLDKQTLEHR